VSSFVYCTDGDLVILVIEAHAPRHIEVRCRGGQPLNGAYNADNAYTRGVRRGAGDTYMSPQLANMFRVYACHQRASLYHQLPWIRSGRFSAAAARPPSRRDASGGGNGMNGNVPMAVIGVPVGIVAGTMGALCGVGGGLVIMPVLKHFTSLSIHQITATSLCSISIASAVAAASYMGQGLADVPIAATMSMFAVLSSQAGAQLNHNLPAKTLSRVLALAMLASAPLILLKPDKNGGTDAPDEKPVHIVTTQASCLGKNVPQNMSDAKEWAKSNWHYGVIGLGVGFTSSLLGVGGGIVMTTYLSGYAGMTQHEAVATSLVAMVPIGCSATFWHMKAGHVHGRFGAAIGVASALAMYIAATHIAPHTPERTMRRLFAGLLSFSAFRMLA
jgi:uncharacterized protein